jgi:hypothetical protein
MTYTKKFYKVSFVSADGIKKADLFMGETPEEAITSAKKSNPKCKDFKAGKTAYNTLGEKI